MRHVSVLANSRWKAGSARLREASTKRVWICLSHPWLPSSLRTSLFACRTLQASSTIPACSSAQRTATIARTFESDNGESASPTAGGGCKSCSATAASWQFGTLSELRRGSFSRSLFIAVTRRRSGCGCARLRRCADSGGTETVPLSALQITTPLRMAMPLQVEKVLRVRRGLNVPSDSNAEPLPTLCRTCLTAQRNGTGASMMVSSSAGGQMGNSRCCQPKGQSNAARPRTTAEPRTTERVTTNTRNSSSRAVRTCSSTSTSRHSKSGPPAHSRSMSERWRVRRLDQGGQESCDGTGYAKTPRSGGVKLSCGAAWCSSEARDCKQCAAAPSSVVGLALAALAAASVPVGLVGGTELLRDISSCSSDRRSGTAAWSTAAVRRKRAVVFRHEDRAESVAAQGSATSSRLSALQSVWAMPPTASEKIFFNRDLLLPRTRSAKSFFARNEFKAARDQGLSSAGSSVWPAFVQSLLQVEPRSGSGPWLCTSL
mmetsp:Transcript_50681/g.151641  ORF Transcript_50681/g.151641 Transcript_50681/m.151641 type:complete len:488 (-) Transcript_50681:428-1891(-)